MHLAVGCHPHFADDFDSVTLIRLEEVVRELGPHLVALGECGLDYSRKNIVPRHRQIQVFQDQVKLALRLDLPLVLHIREAEEDGLAVLEEMCLTPDWPVHRHCFTGEWREVREDTTGAHR